MDLKYYIQKFIPKSNISFHTSERELILAAPPGKMQQIQAIYRYEIRGTAIFAHLSDFFRDPVLYKKGSQQTERPS